MLDIGWSELVLIGIVALIVVGPQDLPRLFHSLGRLMARARSMAREFSSAMEDAAKSSGLDEAAGTLRDVKSLTSKKNLGLDALDRAAERFEKWDPMNPPRNQTAKPAAQPDPAAPAPTPAPAPAPQPAATAPDAAPAPAAPPQGARTGQRRLRAVRRSDLNEG